MSNSVNSELLERASEMITHYEGKLIAQVLEADLSRQDYEALQAHVTQAEAQAAQEEIEAVDAY